MLQSGPCQANDAYILPEAIFLLGLLSENYALIFKKLLYFYVNAFACITEIYVNAITASSCLKKDYLGPFYLLVNGIRL